MTLRILVVEDNPRLADLLCRGIKFQGSEVVLAADGSEGRQRWSEGGFAAIVLDVMLPGINGIDLCAERRQSGDRTPVILLTAGDEEQVREHGAAACADAILLKPFSYAELVRTVARYAGSRDGQAEDQR